MGKFLNGYNLGQIALDMANGEEYFGGSDARSSVVSLYLHGKI